MPDGYSAEQVERPTCQASMSAVPRDRMMPGLGYFGHRMFECEKCKETAVISTPRPR
jgi:hypothetical protein